jgi:hypothetical protein
MQTVTGRGKRLRAALETLLTENGWRKIRQTALRRRITDARSIVAR